MKAGPRTARRRNGPPRGHRKKQHATVSARPGGEPARKITGRSPTETALRKMEERYRALQQTAAGAIQANERLGLALAGSGLALWDCDSNGKVYLSHGWAEMLGEPPGETFTTTARLFELVHPDDLPALRRTLHDVLKGRAPAYEAEHRVRMRSGEWKWILSRGKIVARDAGGRVLRVTGTNADVTARRAAEERERQSEERYRGLVELAPDAVIVHRDERITYVNNAAVRLLGAGVPEELLGRTLFDIIDPRYHALAREQTRQLTSSLGARLGHVQSRFVRVDGAGVDVELAVTSFRDPEGIGYQLFARDVTERRQAERRIQHMAYHDALTGLPNRALLADLVRQALAHAQRRPVAGALLFLDLDRFKTINDSLGHQTGDELLQAVARRLLGCLREGDTLARLGGDEFVVHLQEIAHSEVAAVVAARSTRCCESRQDRRAGTARRGERRHQPLPGRRRRRRHADEARRHCHVPCQGGGPRPLRVLRRGYEPPRPPAPRARDRAAAGVRARRLRTAFPAAGGARDRTHRRRRSPRPLAPPRARAGRSGRVHSRRRGNRAHRGHRRMGAARSLRAGAGLARTDVHDLRLAVNLSSRQFKEGRMVEMVERVLAATGFAPALLELEITEGVILNYSDESVRTMERLNALGVSLSMDDFGTGYSSLAYLKRFPIHKLKIDRSFVGDITWDPDDRAVVNAIVGIGRALGLKLVAEGVETAEQAELLRALGCDEAQGYLYSRALPAAEFRLFLENWAAVPLIAEAA